jgi:protein-tyrosine kinase
MSRIHEALKKAELEHSEGLDAPAPQDLRAALEDTPLTAIPTGTPPAVREGVAEALSLDLLRERLPVGDWLRDSKAARFADVTAQVYHSGAEEFRTLRSRLYHIREKQSLQTILVTSALPGEGKTFVALNLARVIAQQPQRSVLVIDADLRASRVHEALAAARSPGLTEYLQGKAGFLDMIQRGHADNFFFIGSGAPNVNPVELLGTGRLRSLINHLTPVFDWILMDSPPAGFLSDSSLLAKASDGVLLVFQSGLTPYDSAQKVCKEFAPEQLVGVVLNRVPPELGYGHYYYDGYGHSQRAAQGNDLTKAQHQSTSLVRTLA